MVSQLCRRYIRTRLFERLLLKSLIKTLLRSQKERKSNRVFDFFILIPETKPHKLNSWFVKTLPALKITITCNLVDPNIDKFYSSNDKRSQ